MDLRVAGLLRFGIGWKHGLLAAAWWAMAEGTCALLLCSRGRYPRYSDPVGALQPSVGARGRGLEVGEGQTFNWCMLKLPSNSFFRCCSVMVRYQFGLSFLPSLFFFCAGVLTSRLLSDGSCCL